MLRLCKRPLPKTSGRYLAPAVFASICSGRLLSLPRIPVRTPTPSSPHAASPYSSTAPRRIEFSTRNPVPAPGVGEWHTWDAHDTANLPAVCQYLGIPGPAESVAIVARPGDTPLYIFFAADTYWGFEDNGSTTGKHSLTQFTESFASHAEFVRMFRDGVGLEEDRNKAEWDEAFRRLSRLFKSWDGPP
ncbi:hypothetical protein DFH09DRAFT_507855 [Mycena vulgaris]|nr:hypothetical protein DFH09DRAFT_507855 [Mycena vulgaris]